MRPSIAPLAIFFALAFLALGAVFFLLGPAPRDAAFSDNRPTVAATIFPLADIVRQVAGDSIRVHQLLPAGANPHAFEPTPSLMRDLTGTEVIYAIGHGLDDWALALRSEARAGYVVVDKGIALRFADDDHDEDDHDHDDEDDHDHSTDADHVGHVHGPTDPHYWLDVRNAVLIATNVRDDLMIRFPDHADDIHANHARYVVELAELHEEVAGIISRAPSKRIVTLHDAWGYFANAYGLTIVGALEPSPGREPTPGYLAALTEAVHEAGSPVVFSEPGVSSGSLEAFARDNGLDIRMLDPEGGNVPGRMSYVELLRYNATTIVGHPVFDVVPEVVGH